MSTRATPSRSPWAQAAQAPPRRPRRAAMAAIRHSISDCSAQPPPAVAAAEAGMPAKLPARTVLPAAVDAKTAPEARESTESALPARREEETILRGRAAAAARATPATRRSPLPQRTPAMAARASPTTLPAHGSSMAAVAAAAARIKVCTGRMMPDSAALAAVATAARMSRARMASTVSAAVVVVAAPVTAAARQFQSICPAATAAWGQSSSPSCLPTSTSSRFRTRFWWTVEASRSPSYTAATRFS